MSKGRKNGCPINVRDWQISIQDKAQVTETWVRINGLNSLRKSASSTTQDGSAAADLWEEPYVTKRSVSCTLEGKLLANASTGARDEGQEMLDEYARLGECAGDCTLKFVDPYGHAMVADYVVESNEEDANENESKVSWSLKQVGEAEILPYVQVSSVALKDGSTEVTTLSIVAGATPKVITVAFNPENASNQRWKWSLSGKKFAEVTNVTENSFSITPIAAGSATVRVVSMNGERSATLAITVTAPT